MNAYMGSFRRFWLFVRIQSRTSLRTASLLVRAAIKDLLKILFQKCRMLAFGGWVLGSNNI